MKGKACELCGFDSSIFKGMLGGNNGKCPNCQNEGLPYLLSQKRSELHEKKQKQRELKNCCIKCKQLKNMSNFEVDGRYTYFCAECWKNMDNINAQRYKNGFNWQFFYQQYPEARRSQKEIQKIREEIKGLEEEIKDMEDYSKEIQQTSQTAQIQAFPKKEEFFLNLKK